MQTLNSKQTTALAGALGICATLFVVHNPIDGYDFTARHSGGEFRFKEEWQFSRDGCSKELQTVMFSIKERINQSNMNPIEKMAAERSGRSAQIFRQCVQVTTWNDPIETDSEPVWVWQSKGALHPMLATVRSLLVAFALVGLWASVVVFAFREKANAGRPS